LKIIDKLEFWDWAYSDFLSNSLRGVLAEFIVGSALGCLNEKRKEWDAYDLFCKGKKVEVKSAAYLQTWDQKEHSIIRFDIAEKASWYASDNKYADKVERPADIYVFSVFSETNREIANPLNVEQWFFLVMSKDEISQHFGKNKTVGLKAIETAGFSRLRFSELKSFID
jgi:hypothetical protein